MPKEINKNKPKKVAFNVKNAKRIKAEKMKTKPKNTTPKAKAKHSTTPKTSRELRAKVVIKKMTAKDGTPTSSRRAMKEAGYSENYARNPQRFLRTKTAQELMDEYLPDDLIAKTHHELLTAGALDSFSFPIIKGAKPVSDATIKSIIENIPGCQLIYVKRDKFGVMAYFMKPDGRIRKEAIDMAYKRKGDYAAEKVELTKRKYQDLYNAEIMDLDKQLTANLIKK